MIGDTNLIEAIRLQAEPYIIEASNNYETLLDAIGDAQIVLLGEATHGTHEFYTMRADITKELIRQKGFQAVTIEGDWPDAYEVNRYINEQTKLTATQAFAGFDRFPTWMWRNVPTVAFAEWLQVHNSKQLASKRVNFYGLDLYSLYRSIDAVIDCLKKVDPAAAAQAQYQYSCLEAYRHNPQAYAYAVVTQAIESCQDAVIQQLVQLQQRDWEDLGKNLMSTDEALYIEQNARVVKNAEHYYRSMFVGAAASWNVRDSHMFETLETLIKHYRLKGIETPKLVIWAHNSHIGNAAATQMGDHGEYNIGQLVKEACGDNSFSVGFTTYDGTVSAAHDWHAPVERKNVRPALKESYEALFHATGIPNFLLLLKDTNVVPVKALERAIGVVYRPDTERASHYFYANLAEQFDAVIHCDRTTAVQPLEKTERWIAGELPETYPSGL